MSDVNEVLPMDLFESFVSGEKHPSTAEELMKARYMAYAYQKVDYVLGTHAPEAAGDVDEEGAKKWAAESEWLGLEVVSKEAGESSDSTGTVEFIARYAVSGKEFAHHEIAQFRKEDDKWMYVDGEMVKQKPQRRETPKVGRNEPCPCESGKKYKRCCGAV